MFPASSTPGIIYMYANGMIGGSGSLKDVLGNTVKENALLQYYLDNGLRGIDLYDVLSGRTTASNAEVLTTADKNQLAAFILKARTSYGITEVSCVGNWWRVNSSRTDGTITYRRAVDFNLTRVNPLEKIDYLNIESEFWNWNISTVSNVGAGTASITAGSAVMTLTSTATPGTGDCINGKWIIINGETRQIVTANVGASTITVDRPFSTTGSGLTWLYGRQGTIAAEEFRTDIETWLVRARAVKTLLNANPTAGLKFQCYLGHPTGGNPPAGLTAMTRLMPYFDRILPHDYVRGVLKYNYTSARIIAAAANFTGTISSSGTTVTGVGTFFLTDLIAGCKIEVNGQERTIVSIASNTSLTVDAAFSPDITLGSNYGVTTEMMPIASFERPEDGNDFSGLPMEGRNSVNLTCTYVTGSTTLNTASTTTVAVGAKVYGTGMPAGVTIASKTGTTITLSAATTAPGTNVSLIFGTPAFTPLCPEQMYRYYSQIGYSPGAGYPSQTAPAFNGETNVLVQRRIKLVGLHIFDQSIMRSLSPQPSICLPAPACVTPTGLTFSALTSSSVTLSWTSVAGAVGYNIRYRIIGSGVWTNTTSVGNLINLTGLAAGSNYEYQVQTNCGSGSTSAFSSSTNFTTLAASACSVPTGLTVSNIQLTQSTVNWNAVASATSYQIRFRIVGAPTWTTISSIFGTSYILSPLVNGTNYEFQVLAFCGAGGGNSGFSASTTWSTLTCATTPSITIYNILQNSASVTWTNVPGAVLYNFRYRIIGAPSWTTGSTIINSTNLISLVPGNDYEFQVQTDCGSGATSVFTSSTLFTTNPPIPLNVVVDPQKLIDCYGSCEGNLVASTPDGTAPYAYEWTNDVGTVLASINVVDNLCAGVYHIKITDANGLIGTATYTLLEPTPVSFTAVATDVIGCRGAATGTITLLGAGGSPPYFYSKNNGGSWQNTNVYISLIAGSYQVQVKDSNNCLAAAQTVVIGQPAALSFTYVALNPSCKDGNDGSITINVTGGVSPYEYSSDNGTTWQSGNVFSGLLPNTTYQLVVRDSGNCVTATQSVTLSNPNGLSGVIQGTPQASLDFCIQGTDADINLQAIVFTGSPFFADPVLPIDYSWSTGDIGEFVTINFPVGSTAISCTATDANGCSATLSGMVNIEQDLGGSLNIVLNGQYSACDPAHTINASVDASSFSLVEWYLDGSLFNLVVDNVDLDLSTSGHLLSVLGYSTGGLCISEGQIVLPPPANLLQGGIVSTEISCYGCNDGTAQAIPQDGIAPYTYQWSNGQTTQQVTGLAPGTYTVIITDSGGCSTSVSVTIDQPSGILAALSSTPATCIGANNGSATIFNIIGGDAPYLVTWNDANQTTGTQALNLGTGQYIAHVVDSLGQTADFTITVSEYQIDCVTDPGGGGGNTPEYAFDGETIAFSKPKNRWVTRYSFIPEFYGSIRNEVVAYKDGELWLQNASDVYNNFFGVQYNSSIKFPVNKAPLKVKIFKSIALNSNSIWSAPSITIPPTLLSPTGMQSELPALKFVNKEGKFYSDILRDLNTPYANTPTEALINGRPMRGEAMSIKLENTDTTLAVLMAVEVTYIYSEKS